MIRHPKSVAEAVGLPIRAGGTDLMDRRRRGLHTGDLSDLRDVPDLDRIRVDPEGLTLGAKVRLAALATHPEVRAGWPLVAIAAGGLATPQIRAVATLGGNLLQATRCWYYRSPEFPCLRKGGGTCFAREGDHRMHAVFDRGPCLAVHASTVAMALLAYDDVAVFAEGSPVETLADLLGRPGAPEDHRLEAGAVLTEIRLGLGWEGERAGYQRAIARFEAEWPIVEAGARLQVQDGVITRAAVVVGAVASVPLRLPAVEAALVGHPATGNVFAHAAALSLDGANPPTGARYKLDLLPGTVQTALERAMEA